MSEWISVKDSLPEEGERVLTYNPTCGEGCEVDIDYRYDRDFWESDGIYSYITHWMPIPKFPRIKMSESNEIEIRCKDCGNILTDEIKYDLGWHCPYPCDRVTFFDDEDVISQYKENKMSEKTDEEIRQEIDNCVDKLEDFFSNNDINPNTGCMAMMEIITNTFIFNGSGYKEMIDLMREIYYSEKNRVKNERIE